MDDEVSSWYHLSDAHNLRRANKKGQKRRWDVVISENNDDLQSETSHQVQTTHKSTRPEEPVEIEVIQYSPPHSLKPSTASANGNSPRGKQDHILREQLIAFMDPIISPPLTLLSSDSLATRDYNHDAEC